MGYEHSVSSQKRMVGFVLVLLFHVILIYALVNGLARDFVKKIAKNPVMVNIIEEVKLPPPPPPPPPPPKEQSLPKPDAPPPPAYVPPVEVNVKPTESQNTIAAVTTDVKVESAPVKEPVVMPPVEPVKPHVPIRVKAKLNAGCASPKYPEESIEMEEEGQLILSILVDENGHVAESKVLKSSGFTRLDDAARQAFSLCQFTPATADDVAEKSWVQQPFEWKIK